MKAVKKMGVLLVFLIAVTATLHLLSTVAFAAVSGSAWRSNYDMIMMWVNFAILLVVLIKFGINPIKGFLRDQKENIASKIKIFEEEKEANAAQIRQSQQLMQESSLRFDQIKEKIIAEGEKKKQEIIESARRESTFMIDHANFWIDRRIQQAKDSLKSDLIDEAMTMATQRLPKILTPEDNQKFISLFLDEADGN
jgi:F-type H+-transporting ATPase subunit b